MLVCAACSKKESAQSTLPIVNPDQALAELGFAESEGGLISWDSVSGDNGTYIYEDVNIILDDDTGSLEIETLTLSGATMIGDEHGAQQATFASIKAEDLSVIGEEGQLTIEDVLLSDPTPQTAKAFADILSQMDIEDVAANAAYGFGKLELGQVQMSGKEDGETVNFTVDRVDITDANADKIGRFELSGLALSVDRDATDFPGQNMDMNMSLATLDFSDMPINQFSGSDGSYALMARQLNAMNPYENFTGDVTLADFDFDIMGVSGGIKSVTRRAQVKGDVIAVTQKIEDFIITPGQQAGPMQMLSALGYEQFEINSEGVTYMDEGQDLITLGENYLSLKDGFNLSMDAKIEGYGEAFKRYVKNIEGLDEKSVDDATDPVLEIVAMQEFSEGLIDSLNIHEFGMTLDDQGLAERGLSFAAMMQGTEPERVKSQLSGMMLMYTMMLQDDAKSQMMRQMIEAASDFINEPSTLKLGFYPDAPISGATLRSVLTDDESANHLSSDDLGFIAQGG